MVAAEEFLSIREGDTEILTFSAAGGVSSSIVYQISGEPYEALITKMTLRSMQQARYSTECVGHFGLACKYYCHFTSPIRRYPDLLVHRSLKYWLRGEMDEKTIDRLNGCLPEAAARSSAMEQRAAEVERETVKLKKAQYMEGKIGETYDGIISGVTTWGIYVELPDTVEGMIRISDLTDDFYYYDEKKYILVGERTGKTYTLGQKMKITVAGADPARRTVDFMPFEETAARRDHGHPDRTAASDHTNGGRKKKVGKPRKESPFMDRTGRVLSGRAGRHTGSKKGKGRKGRK